jgi:hypothetical protein
MFFQYSHPLIKSVSFFSITPHSQWSGTYGTSFFFRLVTFSNGQADGEPPVVQVNALVTLRYLHALGRVFLVLELDETSSPKYWVGSFTINASTGVLYLGKCTPSPSLWRGYRSTSFRRKNGKRRSRKR